MIIGLSGYATSGKDSIADILVEEFGFAKYAWADTLRLAAAALNPIIAIEDGEEFRYNDALEMYGYIDAKSQYPELRRILQVLGTEVGRNLIDDNVWVDATLNRINREATSGSNIVITDTRFTNEASAIKSLGGYVVRVTRPGIGAANAHPSETGLDDYDFDRHIFNDGDLDGLYGRVYDLYTVLENPV